MNDRPLSILFLNPLERGAWGGVERWLFDLATELRGRGHRIASAGCPSSEWTERMEQSGFPVCRVPLRSDFSISQARRLAAFLREHDVDVIGTKLHRGIRAGGMAARFASRGGLRPKVVAFMGLVEARPGWRYRLTYRWFLDRVVTLSEEMRAEIAREGGLDPAVVECIPYGIRPADYETPDSAGLAVRSELGIPPSTPVALALGRMHLQKRFDVLLEAWRTVVGRVPSARLLIAGGGRMQEDLGALAAKLGLGETVRILGFRRDVPQLLSASDCLAMSSDFEGLPMVILEAMGASRPVVTTDVGSARSMLEPGRSGHVVAVRDAAALGERLADVLASPDRGRSMGVLGRARVVERFPLDRCIAETERSLTRLRGRSGSPS